MPAGKTTDRKPDDLISGRRDFLHFHSIFGSDKKDFGPRALFFYGIGDRYSREYMSPVPPPLTNILI